MINSWFIILNPQAGNGKAGKAMNQIISAFKENGIDFMLKKSNQNGHAFELAREAITSGFRKILAVGGDGTNNEVLNGIFQQKEVPVEEILFANLPLGTGNDWARNYNNTKSIQKLIEAINANKHLWQDVGRAQYTVEGKQNVKYFMNAAGLGYDAFVVQSLAGKRFEYFPKWVYLFHILKLIFQYDPKQVDVRVDGRDFYSGKCYTVNIGNCRYCGGGLQITPHAKPDDDLLALTVVKDLPVYQIFLNLPGLINGNISKHRKAQISQAKKIEVSGENIHLELDGEYCGEGPVCLELAKEKLKFLKS